MWETIEVETLDVVCHHLNMVVASNFTGEPGSFVRILQPHPLLRSFDVDASGHTVPTEDAHYRVVRTGTEILIGGFRFTDGYALLEHAPRRIVNES
jgi:hypothetical protein